MSADTTRPAAPGAQPTCAPTPTSAAAKAGCSDCYRRGASPCARGGAAVARRIDHGGIDMTLDQARGRGDFTPLARLHLSTVMDSQQADVSFDPVLNTAPGLTLYPGWLADLRAHAYQRSREGRLFGLLPARR